jgi:hypothetical protein
MHISVKFFARSCVFMNHSFNDRRELRTNLAALLTVSVRLKLGIGIRDDADTIRWREAAIPPTIGRMGSSAIFRTTAGPFFRKLSAKPPTVKPVPAAHSVVIYVIDCCLAYASKT